MSRTLQTPNGLIPINASVKGDTGPQGIQGIQGVEGPQGLQGIEGQDGINPPSQLGYIFSDNPERDAYTNKFNGMISRQIDTDSDTVYDGTTWSLYTGILPLEWYGILDPNIVSTHIDDGHIYINPDSISLNAGIEIHVVPDTTNRNTLDLEDGEYSILMSDESVHQLIEGTWVAVTHPNIKAYIGTADILTVMAAITLPNGSTYRQRVP